MSFDEKYTKCTSKKEKYDCTIEYMKSSGVSFRTASPDHIRNQYRILQSGTSIFVLDKGFRFNCCLSDTDKIKKKLNVKFEVLYKNKSKGIQDKVRPYTFTIDSINVFLKVVELLKDDITEWIIPYNGKTYDVRRALTELKRFDWVQNHNTKNIKAGDIIYLYSSAPQSRIVYKGAVLAVKSTSTIDDGKYNIPPSIGLYDGPCFEVAVFREYSVKGLDYKSLGKYGLKSVMGARRIDEDLKAYIHSIDLKQMAIDKKNGIPDTCLIPFPIKIDEDYVDGIKEVEVKPLDDSHSQEEKEKHAKSLSYDKLAELAKKQSTDKPKESIVTVKQIVRDTYVSEFAKKRAKGICQLCGQPAPFSKADGSPYLESHHIIWLSEGGADSVDNTVALCPNCHRKMHVVKDKNDVNILLKSNRIV